MEALKNKKKNKWKKLKKYHSKSKNKLKIAIWLYNNKLQINKLIYSKYSNKNNQKVQD